MKITNEIFNELILKTRLNGAGIEAARLHFVEGIENLAECARRCGVSRTISSRIVKRLNEEVLSTSGMVSVSYEIPNELKDEIDDFVRLKTEELKKCMANQKSK